MNPGVSPSDVLLMVFRDWFPQWQIWRQRGVWHATGFMVISASTAEALVEHLAVADPDAFSKVVEKQAGAAS